MNEIAYAKRAGHGIKTACRERQFFHISEAESDRIVFLPSTQQHLFAQIHTRNRAPLFCQTNSQIARTTSNIQHMTVQAFHGTLTP